MHDGGQDRSSVPPETYNCLIHALLSLQGSASYPPTYLYPTYHSPWPSTTAPPIAGPASVYSTMPIPVPHSAGPSPATTPTAQDPEGTEDAMSMVEDKRHRNTAASARFRVKKKLKTLNLERTIADLTGRTQDLEREATDLRRENAWLKEIVLLKGRNFAALNLGSQAPALGNPQDEVGQDDRTCEPESTKRSQKGKDKES